MGGHDDDPLMETVDNPAYTALRDLKHQVENHQHALGTALKAATEQMHSGTAWTGPTAAKHFTSEISGRNGHLPGLVTQILHAVEDEMANTPKTITRPRNRGTLHPGIY